MPVTDFDPGFEWTYPVVKTGEGEPPIFEVKLSFDSTVLDLSVEGEWLAPGVAQAAGRLFKHTYEFGVDLPDGEADVAIGTSGLPSGEYILRIAGTLSDGNIIDSIKVFNEPNTADYINWILNQDFGIDTGADVTNDSFDFVVFPNKTGGASSGAHDVAESFQQVAGAASGSTFTPGEGDKVALILEPVDAGQIIVGEFVEFITSSPGPTRSFSDDFIL